MPVNPGSTVNPDLMAIPHFPPSIIDGQIAPQDWNDFILRLATVTANYREGSFVGTLHGCTTSPTQTYLYIQMFNLVVVTPKGNLTANSNSTACTITGLPASITPTMTQNDSVLIESSGAFEAGYVSVGTNGTITLGRANGSTTFVNDGLAKGLGSNVFIYSLSS